MYGLSFAIGFELIDGCAKVVTVSDVDVGDPENML